MSHPDRKRSYLFFFLMAALVLLLALGVFLLILGLTMSPFATPGQLVL